MDEVRLGIVGLGWFGGELAEGAVRSGAFKVTACFARSVAGREAFAHQHGCRPMPSLEALMADEQVDAIVLATPHSTHLEQIERAAAEGKHVFVEKPLTLTVSEGVKAAAAAREAGIVLQVGHNRRRQIPSRRIRSLIEEGDLGTLLQMEATHTAAGGFRENLPAWRSDPAECPAGGMTALGVHPVDTFQYWAGPATRVSAFSSKVAGFSGLDETTTVMLEYGGGVLGTIGTSYFTPPVVSVAAHGTELSAWNEQDGDRLFVQPRSERTRTEQDVVPIDTIADEMEEFARCVREGVRPETGAEEGIEVAAVIEAVVLSAESGRSIDLDELR